MSIVTKITSKDNPTIKALTLLQKSSKKRKEEGMFTLEGLRLCLDAIDNGFAPVKVFFSSSAINKYPEYFERFSTITDTFEVIDSLFEKVTDTVTPQGILCTFSLPDSSKYKINNKGKYIALENLQDPSNLGAISRTAEAFGIDGIIIENGCDPFSPKSLRASMGALLRIPVIQTENMFKLFSDNNLTSYASVVSEKADKISEISFKEGSVVIIGNEANGISDKTEANSEHVFTIPMSGKAESLNAAVAASIIIWEMCK